MKTYENLFKMENEKKISNEGGGSRPFVQTPDPSSLTVQMIYREFGALKELILSRLGAIEAGIEVAHQDLVRVPTEVQKQVGGLKELLETRIDDSDKIIDEKFKNIEKRLNLNEESRMELKKDTATAVDAALKAAKEAVNEQNASNEKAINKSEAATTKQIDQLGTLVNEIKKGFEDKITDIKERLATGVGKDMGKGQLLALIFAAAAFFFGFIGMAIALFKLFEK